MKKIRILIASILCCMVGYAGFIACESVAVTETSKLVKANLEALTQNESGGEGWVYCRCHNDQHCYVGNAISLRPSCVRLYGAGDCDAYRSNCPPAGV